MSPASVRRSAFYTEPEVEQRVGTGVGGKRLRARAHQPHPCREFAGSALWRSVEKQIAALVNNRDIQEMTAREYSGGSSCKAIAGRQDAD
jgi:hypothetical protein